MSTAAVMLVKDEADIVGCTVRHLLGQVDQVLVADNLSTDGTRELLDALVLEAGTDRLIVTDDEERGYYQAEKTTALAMRALALGHRWVLPVDADEYWVAPDGRRLADWLDGIGREIQFVKARIWNHVVTGADPPASCQECASTGWVPARFARDPEAEDGRDRCPLCAGRVEPNPIRRIQWRQRAHLEDRWGKVACRLRPDLQIHQGNHSANTSGVGTTTVALELRHYPYRSPEQFTKKAINGAAAYAATSLDPSVGAHWRVYGQAIAEGGEEAGHAWFYDAFYAPDPTLDNSLVHDPAPAR